MKINFFPGSISAMPGVLTEIPRDEMFTALFRHLRCDWGDLSERNKQKNDRALQRGERLISAYHSSNGTMFLIITEADRSATTILRPSEY